jgi:hypothetical protein
LLQRLLQFHPAKRLTAEQALAHPYFAGLDPDGSRVVCLSSSFFTT